MRTRRGFVLLLCVLLALIILALGMGLLAGNAAGYSGAAQARRAAQARAVAEAGLEDARLKLERDVDFPLPGSGDEKTFSYSEDFPDASGNAWGSYEVTIDSTWLKAYSVLVVTSVGTVRYGPDDVARRKLTAEMDVSTTRGHLYQYVNIRDEGSL